MSVFNLKAGESGKIVAVRAQGAAAARLKSLGFVCGAGVTALAFSLFNSSILVGVGTTRVSLRRRIADLIEVEL